MSGGGGSVWPWLVVAGLGVALGLFAFRQLRLPRVVEPGPVGPCDPAVFVDSGERLVAGRVYRFGRRVRIPLPDAAGSLTRECVEAAPGWYLAVQRGQFFDPWGWLAVAPGELGVSGLPPFATTRALVYGRGSPSNRVMSTLLRRGDLQLG